MTPMDIMKMSNPQQFLLSMLEQRMGNNELGKSLIDSIRNGRTDNVEAIVRNMLTQQGRDFDKEFNAFKKSMGIR